MIANFVRNQNTQRLYEIAHHQMHASISGMPLNGVRYNTIPILLLLYLIRYIFIIILCVNVSSVHQNAALENKSEKFFADL